MKRFGTDPRRVQLGEMLRGARLKLGMNQAELGKILGYSQSNVSKVQSGKLGIHPEQLEKWIAALKVPDAQAAEMRRLNESSPAERDWNQQRLEATPRWFHQVIAAERSAIVLQRWTGERISGMLQCEGFMLEQFQAFGRTDVDNAVYDRRSRARILSAHPERSFQFLLSESAVDRLTAAPTVNPFVALDQLRHMLRLGQEFPWVKIRVVPRNGPLTVCSDFTIMQFPNPRDNCSFIEGTSVVFRSPADSENYQTDLQAWGSLSSAALSVEETRGLLERAEREVADRTRAPGAIRDDPRLP